MGKVNGIGSNIGPKKTIVPAGKSGMEYQSSGIVEIVDNRSILRKMSIIRKSYVGIVEFT